MTPPPDAVRSRPAGWRDPRLLLGVTLMAVSVLVGAWLVSRSDDSTSLLVAGRDLPAGTVLQDADVTRRPVRLGSTTARQYVAVLPEERTLDRPVHAGELVPRSALHAAAEEHRVEVPLSVATDDLPVTVGVGSVVDVWAVPDAAHADRADGDVSRARLVLEGVTVLRLAEPADSLAPRATRQVIVTVPGDQPDRLGAALGRATAGRLVLTRRG